MTIAEKILQHAQGLPSSLQAEVLDFVEFLETKVGKPKEREEKTDWTTLSLSSAMRGMEDEDSPYTLNDIKETF